ncbi:MAG TPA: L-threonine 3-dehydrogenase [Acidimicrobiales bacterium]|nr:L-threonine 3-dehydrogenase [Acidimicrobiales bacterium]
MAQWMRGLVKDGARRGLILADVPVPVIGRDDVLIRVLRTGICGTDLHIEQWDDWASTHVRPPLVIGHEFVGRIVELGPDVKELAPGDLVSGEGHLVCGRCRNCMAGRRAQCANTRGIGVDRDGAFADYIALPAGNLWRHQPGIDLDVAAIFDPFGNAVHTARAFPVLGEDVLVTGAGPIGLMASLVCRHAGARNVVITDVSEFRLQLARKLGVTRAVRGTWDELQRAMHDLGMKEGFDVGLEMSGASVALQDMIRSMAHGGRIAVLGLPASDFPVDWSHVITNMLTIRGIYGREMFETWYWMSVLVGAGLDISPVITHRISAGQFQEAFDVVRTAECGKVVLDWGEG